VRRILVKEVNWLGDLVLSLPALAALRSAWTGATISVLVREELAGFFDGIGWVDEVIPYRLGRGIKRLVDQRRIIARIRQGRFDLAVLFPNSFRSALWPVLAGVPLRAGYATDGRSLLLTHRAIPERNALEGHQRQYWLAMLSSTIGVPAVSREASHRLQVSPASVARMEQWLASRRMRQTAPLVAIAPGAAYGPAKEWPSPRYAALIDLLTKRAGAECVLVGAPSERLKCQEVAGVARTKTLIAAGETNIAELKALLSLCQAFAGNDSGAMHLAAALEIPAVGIFGSTNPDRTGPIGPKAAAVYHPVECSPCLRRTCRFGHYQCLRATEPEEVLTRLAALGPFPLVS
jgi:heptosyltransferase-2